MPRETTANGTNAALHNLLPIETVEEIDALVITQGKTVVGDYTITINPDPDFPELFFMFIEFLADEPEVELVGAVWEVPTLVQAIEAARNCMKQEYAELWQGLSKG
jgi:hypothetical protein